VLLQRDTVTRRIAVVLGTSGAIEDDELQRVAALPFVKELCRLTLSVREIHSAQFERTIALRTRTARRAIARLALRMGVPHTFRKVRGSTVSLLRETVDSADITVFEPLRIFAAPSIAPPVHTRRSQQRIVVHVDDLVTGAEALIAATLLAEGEMHRVSVLLTAAAPTELDALNRMISDLLPADPARVLLLSDSGIHYLTAAARAERADMLVLGASEELLKPESLQSLLEQLRCPICLVRRWDGSADDRVK
jgi:hypothetical protein